MPLLMQRIDISVASALGPEELRSQIAEIVEEIIVDLKVQLNASELQLDRALLVDDMVGLGPLEPLLKDEADRHHGQRPHQVYVERKGKVELTDVQFRDDPHVLHVATRIVTEVGRRVDESTPGRRPPQGRQPVNIIIPPLAIDGPTISIRKFSKKEITLDVMARRQHLHGHGDRVEDRRPARLNILISGGTGSGKTTLLNAMSRMIDHGERTITIEDAAELQLQQPHVVRLRPAPPTSRARARSPCAASSRTRSACDPTGSSSARSRRGSDRHAAGDEHRPRRLDGHDPLQHPARRPHPPRKHGRHVGLQAPRRGGARADPVGDPPSCRSAACATACGGSPR